MRDDTSTVASGAPASSRWWLVFPALNPPISFPTSADSCVCYLLPRIRKCRKYIYDEYDGIDKIPHQHWNENYISHKINFRIVISHSSRMFTSEFKFPLLRKTLSDLSQRVLFRTRDKEKHFYLGFELFRFAGFVPFWRRRARTVTRSTRASDSLQKKISPFHVPPM